MTASPTPFFAESANKSATHPDAQVGLPSEGAFQRMIRDWQMTPGFDGNDARIAALSTAILDLIRPAFEAKERGGVGNSDGIASPFNACCYRDECRAMEARALSAEAKLAQAVEDAFNGGYTAGYSDANCAWNCIPRTGRQQSLAEYRSAAARGEKT